MIKAFSVERQHSCWSNGNTQVESASTKKSFLLSYMVRLSVFSSFPHRQAYYQRKRAEGKSHTVAVRALANVWARILYAVWKTKEPYQTLTFEQARQAHARRVA